MSKRKDIRKIFSRYDLDPATIKAFREEEDRLQRLKQRNDNFKRLSDDSISFDHSFNKELFDTNSLEIPDSVPCENTIPAYNSDIDDISSTPSITILPEPNNQSSESIFFNVEEDKVYISDNDVAINYVSDSLELTENYSITSFSGEQNTNTINSHCSWLCGAHSPSCILNSPILQQPICISEPVSNNSNSLDNTGNSHSSLNISSHIPSPESYSLSSSVDLLPHLAKRAKPHQFEGLRFLYDNIIEDVRSFKRKNGGFGCILAHSMGLGKTFQSITFIELFLRSTPSTHVLVVVPVNTLYNWNREFDLWLPTVKNCNGNKNNTKDITYTRKFQVITITEAEKTFKQRFKVLMRWKEYAGVLIIGYELFRTLVGLHVNLNIKGRKKAKKFNPQSSEVFEILCDPGPDMVICDEGHRIKNDEAAICQAIKCISTRRRIVLTGYPLQNNLLEYWCMIDFVRPSYLGSKKEFRNLFLRPIENGQCQNSMPDDVRLMLQRTHVLHHMLLGIVQRKSEKILSQNIPRKHEFVLFTSLSQFQTQLYDVIVNDLREERKTNSTINPLLAFAICCKIWNHPEILYEISNRCASASDLSRSLLEDEEELMSKEATCKDFYNLVSDPRVIRNCFAGYQSELLENGPKFLILFDIIESAISIGEKVLVFSQSISTLNLIETFLSKFYVPLEVSHVLPLGSNSISYSTEHWQLGYNYLRLDGSSTSIERHNMISDFNDPQQPNFKLFLVSTRAGSLGINLVSASRIIILDISWNPCHDAQAVCRAYRFGQKRECFVYRLIADGTFESKMYKRQISKISTSERVVDQLKPKRLITKEDLFTAVTLPVEHVTPIQNLAALSGDFEDPILKMICRKRQGILTRSPLFHQSFFLDSSDDHLNDIEKKEASESYLSERKLCRHREVTSRDNIDSNKFISRIETATYSNPRNCGEDVFHKALRTYKPKKSSANTTQYKPKLPTTLMTHIVESTSPISITDSDGELSVIDLDSNDISPPPSPVRVDLVESDEVVSENSFLFQSRSLDSSSFYHAPSFHIPINHPPDSLNDSVIIISDSPNYEELSNTTENELSQNVPNDISLYTASSSQESSVYFVDEHLDI